MTVYGVRYFSSYIGTSLCTLLLLQTFGDQYISRDALKVAMEVDGVRVKQISVKFLNIYIIVSNFHLDRYC